MRKSFIAGNWKMHGTQHSAQTLLSSLSHHTFSDAMEIAVFPPFVHLLMTQTILKNSNIAYGAQTISEFTDGAYTGEISAAMLIDLGCRYVIVGHSERRHLFHETNTEITQKCMAAMTSGLIPILCVGETLTEREKNITLSVVQEQLEVVRILKDNCSDFKDIIIAYEPVWAIGTGRTATPDVAQAVHAAIREQLDALGIAEKTRILYGGSVKPDNAKTLFAMPDIDGALIGGASLEANSFIEIANAV